MRNGDLGRAESANADGLTGELRGEGGNTDRASVTSQTASEGLKYMQLLL